MTCAEIMTPDPITVQENEPLEYAVAILRGNRYRSVPVVVRKSGRLLGIVSYWDIVGRLLD
jgi:CBS domain-containing protein